MEVNITEAKKMGLTEDEFQTAIDILGRMPNYTELGIFSALWSEHCSYKSSRLFLKRFPTTGKRVIQGPGENAGVVDIGDDYAVVFKMESHNHPSYIEPYQGAATGVGGILRDVFTMGARPVINMDSLHFGEIDYPRMKYLVDGVVGGIADYGNCMGVPTVAGETVFEKEYNQNILVNAFTLGIIKKDGIFYGTASGPGNIVMYVGSRTGRDGIHGATMASEEFSKDTEEKRPTVQVGDPFTEKLLLEACLEVMSTDYIVGIQDMGAAGLTSSAFEMAGRAGTGMVIHLDRVPMREEGMSPYELMLSESQERMLIVAKKGNEDKVRAIFEKWDLSAVVIGEITEEENILGYFNGEVAFELPVQPLTEKAPVYDRPRKRPDYIDEVAKFDESSLPEPTDIAKTIEDFLSRPNMMNKSWVYKQYDHMVQINSVILPGGDAALIRLKGTNKGISSVVESNGRYVYLNPYEGSKWVMAEAALNLACVGTKPIAITDCLNYGNPEKPEIMWQFEQSIEGLSYACKVFDAPVVSGNVSFYNETNKTAILPTPAIGMVGLTEDITKRSDISFKKENNLLCILGESELSLAGSEYLKMVTGEIKGKLPEINLEKIKDLVNLINDLIDNDLIESVHDIAEGGLITTLFEMSFASNKQLGFNISEFTQNNKLINLLFSEVPGRVIIEINREKESEIQKLADKYSIALKNIGNIIPNKAIISDNNIIDILKLKKRWKSVLEDYLIN